MTKIKKIGYPFPKYKQRIGDLVYWYDQKNEKNHNRHKKNIKSGHVSLYPRNFLPKKDPNFDEEKNLWPSPTSLLGIESYSHHIKYLSIYDVGKIDNFSPLKELERLESFSILTHPKISEIPFFDRDDFDPAEYGVETSEDYVDLIRDWNEQEDAKIEKEYGWRNTSAQYDFTTLPKLPQIRGFEFDQDYQELKDADIESIVKNMPNLESLKLIVGSNDVSLMPIFNLTKLISLKIVFGGIHKTGEDSNHLQFLKRIGKLSSTVKKISFIQEDHIVDNNRKYEDFENVIEVQSLEDLELYIHNNFPASKERSIAFVEKLLEIPNLKKLDCNWREWVNYHDYDDQEPYHKIFSKIKKLTKKPFSLKRTTT